MEITGKTLQNGKSMGIELSRVIAADFFPLKC